MFSFIEDLLPGLVYVHMEQEQHGAIVYLAFGAAWLEPTSLNVLFHHRSAPRSSYVIVNDCAYLFFVDIVLSSQCLQHLE
jgi:hypothetical protein